MKRTVAVIMMLVICGFAFFACGNYFGSKLDLDDYKLEGNDDKSEEFNVFSVYWNMEADRDLAVNIDAVQNATRSNASGAKITSNAHSNDFPGIIFIWDSKHKDNGYLKVTAGVFDVYEYFILTAKEANLYWDFRIIPQESQQKTEDNCYVFFIPKVNDNGKINMVFLSEWKKKEVIIQIPVIKIHAGLINTSISYNGKIFIWGANGYGQLGVATTTHLRSAPVQLGTDSDWVSVRSDNRTAAIKKDGSLWTWGDNYNGQLGNGTTTDTFTPAQIGTGTDWAVVTVGDFHSLALKVDGSLWSWGSNSYGELGNGTGTNALSPVQVGTDTDWAEIATGHHASFAIKKDGSLWAWGSNFTSRLGDGSTVDRSSPYRIGTETNWDSISSYRGNVLAIKKNGSLWAWGENSYGQLGDGTVFQRSSPVQIGTETNWKSVSSGNLLTAALKNDGSIWIWGDLSYGRGKDTVPAPVQLGTDTDWVDISAGGYHAIAVKKDGSIWTWGNNTYGQLGTGGSYTWDLRFSPVKISLPDNNTVPAYSRNPARTLIKRESNLVNLERPDFVH